ncbi:MAG TPA: aquaporin [Acidimicrobiales bacterium]
MPVRSLKVLAAEMVGTAILLMGGPGSAVLAGDEIGVFGVAIAFGLSLLVAAYVVGPVSGCHINPAVTVGFALTRRIDTQLVPFYIVGQIIGAAIGGGIIYAIANGQPGFSASDDGFATNGWGDQSPEGYNFGAMLGVEIVFTALLVFVVIATTGKKFATVQGGLVAGFTLALIHLVTIPVDNTSVNPARSFGAVLWSGNSDAWEQFWAFIVFPLIGAVLGVLVWLLVEDERLEDTMLATPAMVRARDTVMSHAAPLEETEKAEGIMLPDDAGEPREAARGGQRGSTSSDG